MKKLLVCISILLTLGLSSCGPTVDTPSYSCPSTYTYYYYDNYGYTHYYYTTYNVYQDGLGCYILYYNYGYLTKYYI